MTVETDNPADLDQEVIMNKVAETRCVSRVHIHVLYQGLNDIFLHPKTKISSDLSIPGGCPRTFFKTVNKQNLVNHCHP